MDNQVVHHFGPDPNDVGGMASVIRVLKEYSVGADVVQVRPTWRPGTTRNNIRLTLRAAVKILRIPRHHILHFHLSERGSFIREGMLVILAHRRRLTTVITIHGASFLSFGNHFPRLVSVVLRSSKVITCLDQDVLDFVRTAAPQVRAVVMPNPVPMDYDSPTADKTAEFVVFAGEIGLRKGADVLVRAWGLVAKRRPDAYCVMVGPKNDFHVPPTERLAVRQSVGADEMRDLIRSARVIALPSRAEGMPMVLTEAMSGGRPFVSTPVGGIPELAREGGMLAAVGDDVELAQHLTDLLADPMMARRVGERGRRFCKDTRSVEVIDALLRQLYMAAVRA
jgi:glycosyltransferase involved in cell wall biosynthesis